MSTTPSSDDNTQRLEQIVAYLDGELPPDDSARVEQQLASDDDFRQELQSIDRAWAALDKLPSTVVDDKFLQTTMEMVVDSAQREMVEKTQALPVLRRKHRLTKVLMAIAATLLGVLAFRLVWSNPNRSLLADLPVLYQLDVYSQFENVEFLRTLNQGVAEENWPISQEEFTIQQQQLQLVSASNTRREWLRGISDEQRVTLRANYNRFQGLPDAERERLRSLHQAIESDQDSKKLQQTVIRYEHWLNSLPASEQYSLSEQPTAERAHRVAKMVYQRQKEEALNLSPKELKQFWATIGPQLDELEKRTFANFAEGDRREYQRHKGNQRQRIYFWIMRITPKQYEDHLHPLILDALPEEAEKQFEMLSPRERREQLYGWIRQIRRLEEHNWQASGLPGEALQKDLEEFFIEELDPGEKERLLALPHDQMQQQLERKFRGAPSHRRWGGPPEFGRHPPPGRRPPLGPNGFRRDQRGENPPRRGDRRSGGPSFDGERPGPPPPPPRER